MTSTLALLGYGENAVEDARRAMSHPDAMPWWMRVFEVDRFRLLWAEYFASPPLISWHERIDGRWHYRGIFFDSLRNDPESDWRDGEAFIRAAAEAAE